MPEILNSNICSQSSAVYSAINFSPCKISQNECSVALKPKLTDFYKALSPLFRRQNGAETPDVSKFKNRYFHADLEYTLNVGNFWALK